MEKQNRELFDSVEDWVMEKQNSRAVIMVELSNNREVLAYGKAGIFKDMLIETMKSDPNMVLTVMDALDEYVGDMEQTNQ